MFGAALSRLGLRGDDKLGRVKAAASGTDAGTVPWIDRAEADIDAYMTGLRPYYNLREKLDHWRRYGYVVFEKLIPEAWIDAYRADVDDLIASHAQFGTKVLSNLGIKSIRDMTIDQVTGPYTRIMNFHNQSVAGKKIMLHPTIVDFTEHLFRDRVVAMQSLTFLRGSEQKTHRDIAYVVAQIPSYLCATWIALEDVHQDAGPLEYFPGSHRLPSFDFGNGMFLTPESSKGEPEFVAYLESECAKAGIKMQTFMPAKGDVLFWHAALAHRGGKVNNRDRTRLSLVTHYSSVSAYPRDRRAHHVTSHACSEYGRGLVYGNPRVTSAGRLFQARAVALEVAVLPQFEPHARREHCAGLAVVWIMIASQLLLNRFEASASKCATWDR